jgi:23S rRNA pseudouridine955/2504/2580 synthase
LKPPKIKFAEIVLFEDDAFVIVNKPPFISTLEDRQDRVNLLGLARDYVSSAQVCHRLDKETSGVLVIAKNPDAYRHMSIQLEKRQVTKLYHAVVDGIHDVSERLVDIPILKLQDGVVKLSKREGKPAQTFFSTRAVYKRHTLMECRPVTGRMHQIRVHLATLEAPITGDLLYGGKPFFLSQVKRDFHLKKDTDEEPFMKRMALHAFSIAFLDLTGNKIAVEAPYQKDMQALVRQLEINR